MAPEARANREAADLVISDVSRLVTLAPGRGPVHRPANHTTRASSEETATMREKAAGRFTAEIDCEDLRAEVEALRAE